MNFRRSFFLAVALFSCNSLFAQKDKVSGVVFDALTCETIPYVNIMLAGKPLGTSSLEDGTFKLVIEEDINSEQGILFSNIGYEPQTVTISKVNSLDSIFLSPKSEVLSTIVIDTKRRLKFKEKRFNKF